METNRAKEIIIEVLQKALSGQLNPTSTINPKVIADTIATKVNFEKTFIDSKNDLVIGTIIDKVEEIQQDLQTELQNLSGKDPSEKLLLTNFIHGKRTALEEIIGIIKNL